MRKIFMLAIMVACAAPAAFAQDDYNKYDIFVGYSHNRVDTGLDDGDTDPDDIFDERLGFHGFNVSAKGNVHRYVGIKGDYSFHRKTFQDSSLPNVDVRVDIHNLVGGVQFKDNAPETKVKPFAHLMAGVAHSRFDLRGFPSNVVAGFDDSDSGFAGVIGGGLDFRVSPRVDFRAVQFDYNPTRLGDQTQHNFRVGVGVVFR